MKSEIKTSLRRFYYTDLGEIRRNHQLGWASGNRVVLHSRDRIDRLEDYLTIMGEGNVAGGDFQISDLGNGARKFSVLFPLFEVLLLHWEGSFCLSPFLCFL